MPGRNFVQVGLRGYWPPKEIFDWMAGQKMDWHLMSKVHSIGIKSVIEEAISQALDGPEYIYISLDIDVPVSESSRSPVSVITPALRNAFTSASTRLSLIR